MHAVLVWEWQRLSVGVRRVSWIFQASPPHPRFHSREHSSDKRGYFPLCRFVLKWLKCLSTRWLIRITCYTPMYLFTVPWFLGKETKSIWASQGWPFNWTDMVFCDWFLFLNKQFCTCRFLISHMAKHFWLYPNPSHLSYKNRNSGHYTPSPAPPPTFVKYPLVVIPLLQDHLDLANTNPVIKTIIKVIETRDFRTVICQRGAW